MRTWRLSTLAGVLTVVMTGTVFSADTVKVFRYDGSLHPIEMLNQVERTGNRYYDAELYRLKGELLLRPREHQCVCHHDAGGLVTFPRSVRSPGVIPAAS
jgi:hypothetical protein